MSRKVVATAVVDILVLLVAVAVGVKSQQQQLSNCQQRCGQFYLEFQQVSAQYNACALGCDFYSRLDERTGDQPINTLQNCNDSCDERFEQENNVPACQAGCGFSFDTVSTGLNPPPVRPAAPQPQPMRQQQPHGMMMQMQPGVLSISLPNLINRIMPGLMQRQQHSNPLVMMNMMGEHMMDDDDDEDILEEMESMDPFIRSNHATGGSSSDEASREDSEEVDEFPLMMSSAMSAPPQRPNPFFGRKDDDEIVDPFFGNLFSSLNEQMNRLMQTIPRADSWRSWGPGSFGQQSSGGKIMVMRAGPGYHEQKEYDIGPDGEITEVTTPPAAPIIMEHDALSHENPMETRLIDNNDVEIFDISKVVSTAGNSIEELKKAAESSSEEKKEVEESVISAKQDQNPFLSVLRTSVEESQRFGQELINRYNHQLRDGDYIGDDICQNHNVSWSDWVACVHARLGVPRWLTAATISLGIIFSVWLCLVIPSSAPKQRLRALIIRGKPSQLFSCQSKKVTTAGDAAAAAKEAEANATQQPTVAYIKVDLPPSYLEVTPGSPAPSYKSDMMAAVACPDSPTPSYKSVDVKELTKGDKLPDPVHGKKESEA